MTGTQSPPESAHVTDRDSAGRLSAAPGFEQGVPRWLAHQRGLIEVLITDSVQLGADEFLLGTQLPRAHSTWSDCHPGYHDPLVTVEAGRQAGFVLAHRYYDVPRGTQFISQQLTFEVGCLEAFIDSESEPTEGVFHVRLADKQYRDGVLIGMSFRGELSIEGRPAKSMSGGMLFLPGGDYEGMRKHIRAGKALDPQSTSSTASPLDPESVGRSLRQNVVIAEGEHESRFVLLPDRSHPCFFDHPQDHLPGPLILEAFRQAALASAKREGRLERSGAVLTGCRVQFSDFAELEAPAECSVALGGVSSGSAVAATVGLHQLGVQIAEAELHLTPCPPRTPR